MEAYLRFEAHVEHPVSFVEDEIRHALKVDEPTRVGRQQFDHATRRTNDYFRTALHVGDVVLERHAAVSARSLWQDSRVSIGRKGANEKGEEDAPSTLTPSRTACTPCKSALPAPSLAS